MLTRRERLERIAAAERDRRAGRIELAIASLGDGGEWPARVVLALARLPQNEGDETRSILQASLDTWAAETGLAPLGQAPIEVSQADAPHVERERSFEASTLDTPIDAFELDEAFLRAEAQVDEMHDVNRVAERVLMDEPLDLTELSDEPVDAAWASASIWPTADIVREAAGAIREAAGASHETAGAIREIAGAVREAAGDDLAESCSGLASAFDVIEDPEGIDDGVGSEKPARAVVLATLERWLMNLENNSARRAQ